MALVALLAFAHPVFAQTEAAAPTSRAGAATSGASLKTAKPQRSAKSLDCSKQADTKKLHRAARRKFMAGCKRG
jgi:hypothetical protein